MKKGLLYLLLFAYTIIICKPILPSLCDTVAHMLWYADHMSTVHYEHGKYHVHYENINEAKKEYPQKNTILSTDESAGIHLFNTEKKYIFPVCTVSIHYFISTSANLAAGFSGSNYPPPKGLHYSSPIYCI